MADKHVQDLLEQRSDMMNDRANFDNLYDDVSRFIFPQRARVRSNNPPGTDRTYDINDSTATNAAHTAASAAQGSVVPSTTRWFNMHLPNRDWEELPGVKEWLHRLTLATYDAIKGSNFNTEIQEVFLDIFGYGTGCLFTGHRSANLVARQGFRGIHFKSTQPGFYVVSENEEGLVDTIFRDFKMSAISAKKAFGNTSKSIEAAIKGRRGHELIDIVHYSGPRRHVDPAHVRPNTPAHRLPWASEFIVPADMTALHTGGYFTFPYQVPRWSKMSNELYGRGPGVNALPDIRTLNRAVELRFGAWEKAIDPPIGILYRSVIGNIDIRARGKNIMRQRDAIFPIHEIGNLQAAQFNEEQLRLMIQKAFFIDQIQLPPMGKTPATATEIAGRFETMQRILGPTFGRIEYELFDPLLNVIASLLLREGAVEGPPPALLDVIGSEMELEFEYEGPLTRAQQFQDVENIQRVANVLLGMAQGFPGVLKHFDEVEAGKAILAASSLPPQITRSDDDVRDMEENQAQAQQQQEAMQMMQGASEAVANVQPALEGDIGSVI